MYFGDHSIRFYPDEDHVGTYAFDSSSELDICPDTWKSWHLIPNKKPVFAAPDFEDELVAIPGRHGLVRLTKGARGHTVYGNIKGTIDFTLDPDEEDHWSGLYSDIRRYLHGKERLAVLRDDRYFFYKGLFRVRDINPDMMDTVSVEYSLEPFKYERWDGSSDWLWDDFDFECGIARDYTDHSTQSWYISLSSQEQKTFDVPVREFRIPLYVKLRNALGAPNVTISHAVSGSAVTLNQKDIWFRTLYLPIQDIDNKKRQWTTETITITNNASSNVSVYLGYRGAEL